jgi:hypothetical protein
MQAKLSRPQRKKTVQVSKRNSDLSEVTQSVMTTRLVTKSKTKKDKEKTPRRTRKVDLVLDNLDFRNKSLLGKVGGRKSNGKFIFQGNPFYNSTKVVGWENSMVEDMGESEAESGLSINSLRQGLLHRENSVYWAMMHKKGIHQNKKQFKMPKTSKKELLWPTFIFSLHKESLFNTFLQNFKRRNEDFDYEVYISESESNEKESSKRVGKEY